MCHTYIFGQKCLPSQSWLSSYAYDVHSSAIAVWQRCILLSERCASKGILNIGQHATQHWQKLSYFLNHSVNFTRLLYVPIYARLQIFIQLPPSMTKLWHWHNKYDYRACISAYGGHFESMMWTGWSRLIRDKLRQFAGNWIKNCTL